MGDVCKIEHAVGETRAAVLHKNKPVEYFLRRWSKRGEPQAGDVFSGRITALDKNAMLAFVDLGASPGVLRFSMNPGGVRFHEGQMVRAQVLRAGETGKGPLLKFIETSDSKTPGPEITQSLEDFIKARFPDIQFEKGAVDDISWVAQSEVSIVGGGYIYIEHTRAATMIDVDSGGGQKLKTSIAAAREIARQIRLRGIGGLVLIDFPNFRKKKERADVWQTFHDQFTNDPNLVKIAPFSRFGTIEMTRQRTGATIAQILCGPNGEPNAETLALQALRRLVKEARLDGGAKLVLQVPEAAYDWLEAGHIKWRSALEDKIGARFVLKKGDRLDVYKDEK